MKEENREGKQKLRSFLNQKPGDAADDFEKEALEGFAMLGDEKEIRDLKEKTDRKVAEALLAEESKAPVSRYWYAAAGLLLCIGLSVFFVMKTNKETAHDLAVKQETMKPEVNATDSEEKVSLHELETLKEKDQRKPDQLNSRSDAGGPGVKGDAVAESEPKAAKKAEEVSDNINGPEKNTSSAEPVAYTGAGISSSANSAAPVQPSEAPTAADKKSEDADMVSGTTENRSTDMKALEESSLQEVEISKRSKAKAEAKKKTAKDDALAAPSAQIEAASVPSCYYSGDVKELSKDLKKELKKKDLDRSFKARLHVNPLNQVEQVEMLTKDVFTKQEKEDLDKILKKIGKFKNTTKNTAYYTLDYKP